MLLGKMTREINDEQYIKAIQRMYDTNSVEGMKDYAGFLQMESFRKEIETLNAFGLQKRFDVIWENPEQTQEQTQASAMKISDGKVDMILAVSGAKIKETYVNKKGRKRYRRKIKHAFIQTYYVKSNRALSYDVHHPPRCINCGAEMETQGEDYHCHYCGSHYKAEALKYLLMRFFIKNSFQGIWFLWVILAPAIILAILLQTQIINQQEWEILTQYVGLFIGVFATGLILLALGIGLKRFIKHYRARKKILSHDMHFSAEIFTSRVSDLLRTHPEILLEDQKHSNKHRGVICRSVQKLEIRDYHHQGDLEILDCVGQVDALFLYGSEKRVRLRDKSKKVTLRLARTYGTLTPVHYMPDQFTCRNCGSHEMVEHEGVQVCSYCQTERPMESIDWVLV